VTVAAIQPGLHTQDSTELQRNIDLTTRAAAGGARLVVWREKSLGVDPQHDPVGQQLVALARKNHIYLVVGYQVITPAGQRNEATVIAPDGRYLGVYGKQHPAIVFADDQTSITAGAMPVYPTAFGRLATIICFDLDYTDSARTAAQHGAQILAVPSWDPPGDAPKHYDLLVFRAIENRLTIIKSDAANDSAIIDPYGRIIDHTLTTRPTRAALIAAAPAGTGHTPLVALGNLWGWLIVAGAVAINTLNTHTLRHPKQREAN
jgi:apolipoprotein N-acyltransferase